MLTIKLLIKLINILNKDASPQQIAAGMALGAIIGWTPAMSLHNLLIFALILMLQVNIASALLAAGVFSLFAYAFDPLFDRIGYALLMLPALKPLWTSFYNTPILPWTRFNNTITLGSLVFALATFWPLYLLVVWGVVKYREKLLANIQKWKIVQILKASTWYSLYQRLS